MRKPSHLASCTHWSPLGGALPGTARQGRMKARRWDTGRCLLVLVHHLKCYAAAPGHSVFNTDLSCPSPPPWIRITSGNDIPGGHIAGGRGRTDSRPQNNSTLVQANSEFAVGRSAGTQDQQQKPAYRQKPMRHIPENRTERIALPISSLHSQLAGQYSAWVG